MSRMKRAIFFGCLSGLLWTFAPFWFSSRSPENLKIFIPAGIATGILISLALYKPLVKSRLPTTLLFGVLALFLGALFFGFFLGLIQSIIGYPDVRGSSSSHNPLAMLYMGLLYFGVTATICLKPLYALILVGSSVLTTWLLRLTLRHPGNPPQPS
jgi:hypothetical protein